MKLESWFVTWIGDAFTAPEVRGKAVAGLVYGHDQFPDGAKVLIGQLVKSEGWIVTTKLGEVYELGKPEAGYLEWLKSTGIPFDEANPVKLVDEYKYPAAEGVRR